MNLLLIFTTLASCDVTQQELTCLGDSGQHSSPSQPNMDVEQDEKNVNRMGKSVCYTKWYLTLDENFLFELSPKNCIC